MRYAMGVGRLVVVAVVVVAGLCAQVRGGAATTAVVPEKPVVVAHYMSWYQTPEVSGSWGFWQVNRPTIPREYWHWPEKRTESGGPDVASVYCPVVGPYDSGDPDLCEYHILLAKLAGIDAFVADWYGPGVSKEHPYDNTGFLAMKKAAEGLGFKVMICWEDRSMFPPISPGVTTRAGAVERGKEMVRYLQKEWFSSPAYLRIGGRPVMTEYTYGEAGPTMREQTLSAAEWDEVLGAVEPKPMLIHDWHRHYKRPEFAGYASVVPWGDTYHGNLDRAEKFWPAAEEAVRSGANLFLSGAVLPGFDNRGCGGWGTDGAIGVTDRRGGAKFRATWEDVMRHDVRFVQIATWNDFNEGGTVEPVREIVLHASAPAMGYGYRELETVAEFAGKLKGRKYDAAALRLPERLYRARKELREAREGKGQLLAGESVEAVGARLDRARDAILAGDTAKADGLLGGK